MDNRAFQVNGYSDNELRLALELVFQQAGGHSAVSWAVMDYCIQKRSVQAGYPANEAHGAVTPEVMVPCLVLLPHRQAPDNPFPAPVTGATVVPSVTGWLFSVLTRYPQQPDHDGSNKKGWLVFLDMWEKVGHYDAICGIRPEWMWFGK